jgi:hypothetical protein
MPSRVGGYSVFRWDLLGGGGNNPVNDRQRALCERALKAYGVQAQLDMAIEEMAELTKAILKWRRGLGPKTDILQEGVDVQLMLMQVETLFPSDDWQLALYGKENRLLEKLDRRAAGK